jgi:hypothetical protein
MAGIGAGSAPHVIMIDNFWAIGLFVAVVLVAGLAAWGVFRLLYRLVTGEWPL